MNENTIIVASTDLTSAELDGEMVVLDMHSGQYFGLNEVGARILSLVREPKQFGVLIDELLEHYEVERDRLRKDALVFLDGMKERNWIEVREGDVA